MKLSIAAVCNNEWDKLLTFSIDTGRFFRDEIQPIYPGEASSKPLPVSKLNRSGEGAAPMREDTS